MKKRIITGLLASLLALNTFITTPLHVNAEETQRYTTNSPLMTDADSIDIDKVNPYEIECFAVFMSNFCIPFYDSYNSAFSSAAPERSKGAGLQALSFSVGGDVNATSITRRYTTYIMDNMSNVFTMNPIKVKQYAITGADGYANTSADSASVSPEYGGERDATLADLFPMLVGLVGGMYQANLNDFNFDYTSSAGRPFQSPWFIGGTSGDIEGDMQDLTIIRGILHDFYLADNAGSSDEETGLIWSTRDTWDIQVPSQLLHYAVYKVGDDEAVSKILPLLEDAANCPLYMDCIGNIVVHYNAESIVIVPACMNQHITRNKLVNFITAPMINSIYNQFTTNASNAAIKSFPSTIAGMAAKNNGGGEFSILGAGIGSMVGSDINTTVDTSYSFIYNSAIDEYEHPVLGITIDDRKSDFANMNSKFITQGFDVKHLRWSSANSTKQGVLKGLDVQNICGQGRDGNKPFVVNNNISSSFTEKLEKTPYTQIIDSLSSSFTEKLEKTPYTQIIDSLSILIGNSQSDYVKNIVYYAQLGAQLYITHKEVNLDTSRLKTDFFSLKTGSSITNSIFMLTEGADERTAKTIPLSSINDTKRFCIYTGIGQTAKEAASTSANTLISLVIYDSHRVGNGSIFTDHALQSSDMISAMRIAIGQSASYNHAWQIGRGIENPSWTIAKAISKAAGYFDENAGILNLLMEVGLTDWDDHDFANQAQNYVRILPASPTLKAAALLDDKDVNRVYQDNADSMYYTYLYIYGFIGTKTGNNFEPKILSALQNPACTMTPEQAANDVAGTNGLTAEDKKAQAEENARLMLDPGRLGTEYRVNLFNDWIQGWMAKQYNVLCYGNTDSEYYSTLLSTDKSFIKLEAYSENFLTKSIVANWDFVLPLTVLFLAVFICVFGTINGKKITWIIVNVFMSAVMLVMLPAAAEITPYVVDKVADSVFENVAVMVSCSEAIEDDVIFQNIQTKYSGYGDLAYQIQTAYEAQSSKSTSGSLMLKQDITRKVISNVAGQTYTELKGLATAQWLLPSLFEQESSYTEGEDDDYVYRSVGNKRKELRAMSPSVVTDDNYLQNIYSYTRAVTNSMGYDNRGDDLSHTYTRSIAHGISRQHVYNLILHSYNGSDTVYTNKLNEVSAWIVTSALPNYDGTPTTYDNYIGYMQGTESILPYFYWVAYDTVLNGAGAQSLSEVSVSDFYYNMLPEVRLDGIVSNNFTTHNGYSLDCGDLEYLLKFYVPYLVGLQDIAAGQKGVFDTKIGPGYPIYEESMRSFIYKCNWADKILRSYGYGDDVNPYTYPANHGGREMIFSRKQLSDYKNDHPEFNERQLTTVELRCIEANDKIAEQWLSLMNYVAQRNMTTEILVEQMAFTATIEFNKVFAKDNIVNSNLALYPKAFTIRNVSFDRMMKFVLMTNFNFISTNQNSMTIVLDESGVLSGLVLLFTAWLVTTAIPFIMALVMGITFYATILSCAYNAAIDGKDKLKTCGGASITAIMLTAETALYIWSYRWLIGDTQRLLSVDKLNSIAAGQSTAVSKLYIILLFTIVYAFVIIVHAWHCLKNFKDMGFQMWASYSQKTFMAVQHGINGVKNFFKPGSGKSDAEIMQGVAANDPLASGSKDAHVHNTPDDPLYVKEVKNSGSPTYIEPETQGHDNSGYISEHVWEGTMPGHENDTPSSSSSGSSGKKSNTKKKSGPKVNPDDTSKIE